MNPVFLSALIAFIAVAVLMPLAIRLALRLNFVDAPGGRKRHAAPVPPIGGLVIFPVYMAVLFFTQSEPGGFLPLFSALAIILTVGALDDYRHIQPWIKFSAHFLCAFIVVVFGEARLYQLGDLFGFGDVGLGFASIPFSIVAVVLLINAVNLMDGLDGLAGGQGFIIFLWLIVACILAGNAAPLSALAPFLGAMGGFLLFNLRTPLRKRAAVFLGDAGSMALGLIAARFCMDLAQRPEAVFAPIAVAWILALPIFDICAQFNRRVREKRHPFSADRGHFHHHFIHAGFPVSRTVALILSLVFIFGGIGVAGLALGAPEWALSYFWIALLFAHMALSRRPGIYTGFLARFTAGENRRA